MADQYLPGLWKDDRQTSLVLHSESIFSDKAKSLTGGKIHRPEGAPTEHPIFADEGRLLEQRCVFSISLASY